MGDGGDAVTISATSLTTKSALKVTSADNQMGINVAAGVTRLNGGTITQGVTVDTSGGVQNISVTELINGYMYLGAAGDNVNLTFPGAASVKAALANMGIISAAGTKLPSVIVEVTDSFNLSVVANGSDETVHGTAAINNGTATIHYVFTTATDAAIVVVQDA